MNDSALDRCADCQVRLDPALFASCAVCDGRQMCTACARLHLCTSECGDRGCIRGLCVKIVRDGVTAEAYGIDGQSAAVDGGTTVSDQRR